MEINALIPGQRAESITTIRMGDNFDITTFQHILREKFNVAVGGGLGLLINNSFRIGHMGDHTEEGLEALLSAADQVLATQPV